MKTIIKTISGACIVAVVASVLVAGFGMSTNTIAEPAETKDMVTLGDMVLIP